MGDLNAKVGADNSGSDRVMGRHGCGIINENGERLVEFCTSNDLVTGSTLFHTKRSIDQEEEIKIKSITC